MESEFIITARSVIHHVRFSTQLKCLGIVMGFCNIRRSVVCMFLMIVLSNARHLLIPNSSSAVSVDTDCPVERLESRLSSIEDQLNRIQRINNPFIKGKCYLIRPDKARQGSEREDTKSCLSRLSTEIFAFSKFQSPRCLRKRYQPTVKQNQL